MQRPPMHSVERSRAESNGAIFDKFSIVSIAAAAYPIIVAPLLIFVTTGAPNSLQTMMEPRPENRIFWPALAMISIVLAVRYRSRLFTHAVPPNIICLLVYLGFAGVSVLWAFKPDFSFVRFAQQVMVVTSIALPAMLAGRTTDLMRGLFLCFALASILNVVFVLNGSPQIATYGAAKVAIGYPGYFPGKNYLGECAAMAFLLSLHELIYPGFRRASGIVIIVVSMFLLFMSNSKTALGLAFAAPLLSALTLIIARATRMSPAIIVAAVPLCYIAVSSLTSFNMNRISYMLYGDSTFTGRTIIWDFAQREIDRRPLLGWGYQSFWLVGPDAPSVVDAPGWIKDMPNAHNGYYDTKLEMGYVGLALLTIFIFATLHVIGRVADRDAARARLALSLAFYMILYNFLESLWMRGFEFMWVMFLIVASDIGRYLPLSRPRSGYASSSPRPGILLPSRVARTGGVQGTI